MKNVILFVFILITILSCNQRPEFFKYTITGKVIGQDTGKIFFGTSNRLGDDVIIPIENGTFHYEGESQDIIETGMLFYDYYYTGGPVFPFVIEPGIIELELHKDSTYFKSKILQGKVNLSVQKIIKKSNEYFKIIFDENNSPYERDSLIKNIYSDSLVNLIILNVENYGAVHLLYMLMHWDIFDQNQLKQLFSIIQKPELRSIPAFKKVYSYFLRNLHKENKKGNRATDFSLTNQNGKIINFNDVSKGKTVFVELSGSWCGNQTNESRNLIPLYEKYNEKGFEIITIVQEAKYDRWENWLEKERFPWINVIEMEYGNPNEVYYADLLFSNGDYLVDENGFIIANDISAAKLNEILMEKYEPEEYSKYLVRKWELPEDTYLLDREKQINTFDELISKFAGKAVFIDCYATWCSPCIEEFKYKEELKEFLNKHNIELVYISFDKKLDDAKWLNFITTHDLTGYHMRTNEDFGNDFIQKAKFNGQLPTYLIISENGKIVENNALRPSQKKELFNQIESKLN